MHVLLQLKLRIAVSTVCIGALGGACQSTFASKGSEDPIQGGGGAAGDAASATGMAGASPAATTSGGTGGNEHGVSGATDTAADSGDSGAGGTVSGAAGAPDLGTELGASCADGKDCESGRCADGVCCNEACDGVCMRCDAHGARGTCVAAPSDPACGELECPASTECRQYGAGAMDNNCADMGACATEVVCTIVDDPLDATCGTAEAPGFCDGAGECVIEGKLGLGESCTSADDCASQHCVEGLAGGSICCDSLCDGICESCGGDGHCDAAPADDDRCEIDCPDSTACQSYPSDPPADRCQAFGQCVTEAAYCTPSNAGAGTSCGTDRSCDGSGSCVLTCPTTTGADRTCTSDCPCGTGEGVCTANNQCDSGLSCVSGAGAKFGFPGNDTCLPAHCNNDVQDSGETSIDCGGECGCTVSLEWFAGSGFIEAISDDGSTIVGWTSGSSGYGFSWNKDLEMTQLGTGAYGVNGDGSVIVGSDDLPVRWLNGSTSPTPLSNQFTVGGAANAVSANGQIIVGAAYDSLGFGNYAFVWNNGSVSWDTSLRSFYQVSADGEVMVADAVDGYFIRTSSRDEQVMLPAGGNMRSRPQLSRDGRFATGSYCIGSDCFGYLYRVGSDAEVTTFEGNGDPYPSAISNSGLIVGTIGRGGLGRYWHPDEGYEPKLITELMVAHGFELDASTLISGAEAMTPDGRVIVGTAESQGKYKLMFDIDP